MRKKYVLLMLLALTFAASNAWAQGFGVYEHSACVMGRGGASVAQPCNDGSSVFFNPAGIVFVNKGAQLGVNGTVISPRGFFTNDNNSVSHLNNKNFPIPSGYFVANREKWAFGVGMFAPYGLTTDWPVDFEGRFLGYHTSVKGLYLQPTVAVKLNDKVAIGGGLDVSYASLELNQHIDLSSQALGSTMTFANIGVPAGTDFANATLSGNHIQYGGHVGLQAKLTDKVAIGFRYMSRQKVNIKKGDFRAYQIATNLVTPVPLPIGPGGSLIPAGYPIDAIVRSQFTGTGGLAVQNATTSIMFPDQFVVGTAVKVRPATTVLVDFRLTTWSLFDKIVISRANSATPITMVENYKNAYGVHAGVEHELNPKTVLRGGFIAHGGAAPDETVTPLLPEGKRAEVAGGLGYRVAPNMRADFAYQYLFQYDRRGRTIPVGNNGTYHFMSHLFSVTLSVGL